MIEKGGTWNSSEDLPEAELQVKLRDHLRSRGTTVTEGAEMGGGETDLVLYDRIVVENKIRREKTRDPFEAGAHYAWQARRYSRALCSKVVFVVLGYRPSDEAPCSPCRTEFALLLCGKSRRTFARFGSSCLGEWATHRLQESRKTTTPSRNESSS